MTIRMKMKQKRMRKIGIASALGLVVLVVLGLYGASNYMLNYSLNYPKEERMTAEHWKNRMKNECCLLYTSPSPRDGLLSRMPSSA